MSAATTHSEAERAVIWHDAECGGYEADLPLWRSLCDDHSGPVLELGTGTGRVALDLARRGVEVDALDIDSRLVDELARRAAELPLRAIDADLLTLDLGRRYGLILAPMQVVQLLDGPDDRARAFARARDHLEPGGALAVAMVEGAPEAARAPDAGVPVGTLPDICERDGWVYSSLPLGVDVEDGAMLVRRRRQVVSPAGDLSDSEACERLAITDAATIEAEAREAGFALKQTLEVAATDAHIGSLVLLLEAR